MNWQKKAKLILCYFLVLGSVFSNPAVFAEEEAETGPVTEISEETEQFSEFEETAEEELVLVPEEAEETPAENIETEVTEETVDSGDIEFPEIGDYPETSVPNEPAGYGDTELPELDDENSTELKIYTESDFKDPNLYKAIYDQLKKYWSDQNVLMTQDKIDAAAKSNYFNLSLSSLKVSLTSIEGIEVLAKQQSVNLSGHKLTDISPVLSLPDLTTLDVENNDLADIPDLSGTKITYLNLKHNHLTSETLTENKIPSAVLTSNFIKSTLDTQFVSGIIAADEYYLNDGKYLFLFTAPWKLSRPVYAEVTLNGKTAAAATTDPYYNMYKRFAVEDLNSAENHFGLETGKDYTLAVHMWDDYDNELNQSFVIRFDQNPLKMKNCVNDYSKGSNLFYFYGLGSFTTDNTTVKLRNENGQYLNHTTEVEFVYDQSVIQGSLHFPVFTPQQMHPDYIPHEIRFRVDNGVPSGVYDVIVTWKGNTYVLEDKIISTSSSVAVTGITLDQTSLTLGKGSSATLTATVQPSNSTDKSVIWTSSNSSVATVNGGKVTAIAAGTATITAKTNNGKSATCTVTVKDNSVAVTGITLDKSSVTMGKGNNFLLTATITPANATDKTVTWESSDTGVATVSNGTVKAVGIGTAEITAKTVNGKTASCTVTVSESITEKSGLLQDEDGSWNLYENGAVRTSFAGLYPYGTSLFYLSNGVLDRTANGIYYTQGTPYYVVNGQVTYNYTGLGEYKGSLHYFTKSVKDETFNGIAYYKGDPYFVVNGKVTYNYVGLGEYKGSLHYFTKSKKDTTFTGLSYYKNEPYYVLNGIVSYKYNGLGQYKTDWWYVVDSKVDKTFSGTYTWKSKKYTIKNGKVVN